MTNSADETPDPTTPSPEEPIDAVFEPADEGEGPGGERPKDKPGGVGYAALFTASAVAAIAGGAFGVIGSGASGVDSSKFAPAETIQQIRELQSDKNALTLQVGELETRLAELKASDEGEAERVQAALDARADGEQSLRLRLEDLLTQLDALVGGDTSIAAAPSSADAEDGADVMPIAPVQPSPLVRLMRRIETLEARLSDEGDNPETPKQLRRTVRELGDRLDELEAANADLMRANDKRSAAITALQSGLFSATHAIEALEGKVVAQPEAAAAPLPEKPADNESPPTPATDKSSSLIEAPNPSPSASPTPAIPAADAADADARAADPLDAQREAIANAALALAEVEASSARGKPFPTAWRNLSVALPDNEDVRAVRPISRKGAPPLAELSDSFDAIKKQLLQTAAGAPKSDGWDWARQAFGGVVNVRRTDGPDGDPTTLVRTIGDALDNRDLAAAVAAADKLDGEEADILADWLIGARARLMLDTRLDAVRDDILSSRAELTTGDE